MFLFTAVVYDEINDLLLLLLAGFLFGGVNDIGNDLRNHKTQVTMSC